MQQTFDKPIKNIDRYQLTQFFGGSVPSTKPFYDALGIEGHNGIDIGVPQGTKVLACFDGRVKTYYSEGGGYSVLLYSEDGKFRALYCHLSEFKVKNDNKVKTGDVIALSGNTGKYTTGSHLHFGLYELNKDGSIKNSNNGYNGAIDPIPFLAEKILEGVLVKNESEEQVYMIINNKRLWIGDENMFKWLLDYSVSKATIHNIDNITNKYYPYVGRIETTIDYDDYKHENYNY